MVLRVDVIDRAISQIKAQKTKTKNQRVVLLTPKGRVFKQKTALKLSKLRHLILIAGHYEGVDERVRTGLVDEEISIGDYVLTGGEIPALVLIDGVTRLLPGARGGGRGAIRSTRGGWIIRITPGRPTSGASRSPRCCCPATTRRSPPGARRGRSR